MGTWRLLPEQPLNCRAEGVNIASRGEKDACGMLKGLGREQRWQGLVGVLLKEEAFSVSALKESGGR